MNVTLVLLYESSKKSGRMELLGSMDSENSVNDINGGLWVNIQLKSDTHFLFFINVANPYQCGQIHFQLGGAM